MADQTVRITSLPDDSAARVAHDLYLFLRTEIGQASTLADLAKRHLGLYEQCLNAAKGHNVDTSKLT
jgi:hypothetical protein